MHIVIDENIPEAQVFEAFGRVTRLAGRSMQASDVRDADALIVRSVTQVDQALLEGSSVRFVGTCTIGTDHLDLEYLSKQGIGWTNAPGCNAQAVVEYVLAALEVLVQRTGDSLEEKCFGIVGVGNVGSRLAHTLGKLGFKVLLCDPPRREQEQLADYVSLAEILARCDVISLHTPLEVSGQWPTHHLLSEAELKQLRAGAWLLNAARGPVIDNQALLAHLRHKPSLEVVLDVWEGEPDFEPELAALCQLATPHIAGYSLDGKIRGTEIVFNAFCQFFALTAQRAVAYPKPVLEQVNLDSLAGLAQWRGCLSTLLYDPRTDDAAMRRLSSLPTSERKAGFDALRKNYPVRRELNSLAMSRADCSAEQAQLLDALNIRQL